VIYGDGKNTRDFIYVKETARILAELLNFQNLNGEVINVGSGIEISIKNVVEKIIKLMKKDKLKIKYIKGRPADVPRLVANSKKISSLTNIKVYFDFDESLLKTISYFESYLLKNINTIEKLQLKNWE
jgi:UDP-glucose 4-epimerase